MQAPSPTPPNPVLNPVALELPPYGLINAENAAFLSKRPVPERFRLDPASRVPSGADEWESWLAALAQEMSNFLWPIYRSGAWTGDAGDSAAALTRADFGLLRTLQLKMSERILGQGAITARQIDAFLTEDDAPPGSTFEFYQSKFPAMLNAELKASILTGGRDIARPASQGLKKVFQRPRPHQVAMLWGIEELVVQPSKSAITPAMISGHCVQGALALAQVQASMGDVLTGTTGLLDDVQRFLIDTGDRRVYAGLHYPSDNLGSWFVALRLCEHVYGIDSDTVRRNLWEAIQKHSAVFHAISKTGTASPYAPLLDRLNSAANPRPAPNGKSAV